MNTWLTHTPRGWVEPRPPACPCGEARHLIGWTACDCGGGSHEKGHRTWECKECGRYTAVGCVGRVDVLNECRVRPPGV